MRDEWVISESHVVPPSIIRPSYVGKRNQKFPSLSGRIERYTKVEEIKSMKVAANLAARTLKHAMDNTKVGMTLD